MRHLMQPVGSRLCGQTCLAMILGTTVHNTIVWAKKKGGTRTKDLRELLEKHGRQCSPRMKRGYPTEDGMFLLTVHFHGSSAKHWVILLRLGDKEMYYDPEFPCVWYELPNGYVTSYMGVGTLAIQDWERSFNSEYEEMMRRKKARETGGRRDASAR